MPADRATVFVMEAAAKAALPIIESLGRAGVRVVAGSEKRVNTGFFSRWCSERRLYPSPRASPEGFRGWLLDFVRQRSIDVLVPLGHYGALEVCRIQDELRPHTRVLLPDLATFLRAYAKVPTLKTAAAIGVPIPESWYPAEEAGGLEAVLGRIGRWPILIKPSVGVGARGIVWCHTAEEVLRQYREIVEKHGESYLQDFVPPGGMQYKVDMLVDGEQRVLANIVYGKTRMYPPEGGSSVLNFSADRPDILDLARRMLVALRWVGFCDFDFVVDPRDGLPKLMEINPRPPESFNMGPSVGIDFPLMMYRLARGEAVAPVLQYPFHHFLRFLPGDVMWFLRVSNKERLGTWPSWFHFFGKDISYQLCRATDWGPILGYLLENALAVFDRHGWSERLRWGSGRRSPGGSPHSG
jgi:predicted ATP-grasp superfamily ATP-dependent carboligase